MRILTRDNFTCNMCDRSLPEYALEVDHIIPLSDFGPDTDANLQTLCIECHYLKTQKEREAKR